MIRSRRSLKVELTWTYAIQGIGAVASLATLAWLSGSAGPVGQGAFSKTKIEIEFLVALGAVGLPQALIYFTRVGELRLARAVSLSLLVAVIGGLATAGYSMLRSGSNAQFALLAAVVAMLVHGCARSLSLVHLGARTFNWVTAAPQLLMLLMIIPLSVITGVSESLVAWIFAVCYSSVSVVTLVATYRMNEHMKTPGQAALRTMMKYGAATWISALAANLALLSCTLAVADNQSGVNLGVFGVAIAVSQMLLLPINYASPVLFERWVGVSIQRQDLVPLSFMLVGPAILCAGAWCANGFIAPPGILGGYAPLWAILPIVLTGVVFESMARMLAVMALSRGTAWLVSMADIARASFTLLILQLLSASGSLRGVAWTWAAASLLAALILFAGSHAARRGRHIPSLVLFDDDHQAM